MRSFTHVLAVGALMMGMLYKGYAHCQIPCGIYGDQARIHEIEEHIITIEKAMKKIESETDTNQSVRWVINKEDHAAKISEIITYYFMAQRIKPGMDGYDQKLATLHGMLVTTMKCKQTTDVEQVKKLKELTHHFEHLYFGKDHTH